MFNYRTHSLIRCLLSLVVFTSMVFLVACGGGGGGGGGDGGGGGGGGSETYTQSLTESEIVSFHPFQSDATDTSTFAITQPIPPSGATNIGTKTPIILFFNDNIDPTTINDSTLIVSAGSGGLQIFGYISGSLTEAGNTILTFSPPDGLPPSTNLTVSVGTGGILDKGGNSISSTTTISFTTGSGSGIGSVSNLDFESGLGSGFGCSGDCGVLSSFGSAPPSQGSKAAYISTGFGIVSTGSAVGGTTSTLSMAPVETTGDQFSFTYDFISEEFDEFVGSIFDDSFIVILSGPNGSISTTVATVNSVGIAGSTLGSFPGLFDAEHTGLQVFSADVEPLGSPLSASFIVSDVGDTGFTSVVMMDDIKISAGSQSVINRTPIVTSYSTPGETSILVWSTAPELINLTNLSIHRDGSRLWTVVPQTTLPLNCTSGFTGIFNFGSLQKTITPGTYEFKGTIDNNFGIGGFLLVDPKIEWKGTVTVNQDECTQIEFQ